jgi:hypothetical protein
MRVWKLLGLAGILAGVATGAAVARDERVRRHYEPDEIRERLHRRHDEALAREASQPPTPAQPSTPAG